jgi:putative transcriptional regulator
MTRFGVFLEKRMINKSKLGEIAGLTRQRISELTIRDNARFRLDEAYHIAKALGITVDEMCKELFEEKAPAE